MKFLLFAAYIVLFGQLINGQTEMTITDKQIKKTKVIPEPVEKVWQRWTTHDGLKTFIGQDNKIELTPGGAFEIYFIIDNPAGLRGSEGCKVLSYLPYKMLSFSWNAPPQHKEVRESEYKTWVVVNFNPLPDNQTEIVITHLGWPDGDKWSAVFDYFNNAWEIVLESLSNAASKN